MSKAAQLAAYQAGLKTALIEFTDGDDAITIADAGVVTLLTTAVAKSEGGDVTTNIAQGLAKMWLSFNGTGTIAVDDSLNIASLTDAGTGNYTNTFTNAMSAATFAAFAGGDVNNSNNDIRRNNRLYNTTTALVKVSCGNNANSDSKEDWTEVFTSAFGDLA